jgi:hypothetical protein
MTFLQYCNKSHILIDNHSKKLHGLTSVTLNWSRIVYSKQFLLYMKKEILTQYLMYLPLICVDERNPTVYRLKLYLLVFGEQLAYMLERKITKM